MKKVSDLVVLHIAKIGKSSFSGVDVAVPQHIKAQSNFCACSLYNVSGIALGPDVNQIFLDGVFKLDNLTPPFNKPDVVVFHEVYHVEYLAISKALSKAGVPYLIIPHGSLTKESQQVKRLKKLIANTLLFNRFIKGAAAIQCLSEKESSATIFKNNKFVGTNGIGIPEKRKSCFNEKRLHFVYIGRLDVYVKGLDLLIDAIGMHQKELRKHNCLFDLYGPNTLGRGDQVRKLIYENKIDDIVKLHPPVSGKEKESILLSTDFFIQTSRSEGMPMGILEALSYGVPCLVSQGTRLAETIDCYHAGLTSKNDVDSIANMINSSLKIQNEDLVEMSKNANSLIKAEFEWNNIAERCVSRYLEIINDCHE